MSGLTILGTTISSEVKEAALVLPLTSLLFGPQIFSGNTVVETAVPILATADLPGSSSAAWCTPSESSLLREVLERIESFMPVERGTHVRSWFGFNRTRPG